MYLLYFTFVFFVTEVIFIPSPKLGEAISSHLLRRSFVVKEFLTSTIFFLSLSLSISPFFSHKIVIMSTSDGKSF